MELLSKSGPIMMTVFHALVIGATLSYGYSLNDEIHSIGTIALIFFLGFISWSLGEYTMHRFLFHIESKNRFVKSFHYAMHGYHHRFPNDIKRLFMPPVPALLFLSIFFGMFYLLIGSYAWYFLPGFEFGYLVYSFVHYSIHKKGLVKYFKGLGHHHIVHHYKAPEKAFGVSTTFWDRIFKTMP